VLSLNDRSSHCIHIKIERRSLRRSRSRGFRVRLDVGIREIFACGIWKQRKFCFRNPESWALGSEIQLNESGIPLTIELQNPTFTDKDWNRVLVSGIHCVESRIQNYGMKVIPVSHLPCNTILYTTATGIWSKASLLRNKFNEVSFSTQILSTKQYFGTVWVYGSFFNCFGN